MQRPLRVERVSSYDHLSFPRWQVRLLLTSSTCFIISAAVALYFGHKGLSTCLAASGACSLNYWRRPGPSFRREADIAAAGCALLYCIYAGFWLQGAVGLLGFGLLLSGLFCFTKSWVLSLGHNDHWAWWHAGAHALANVAAVVLAAGSPTDAMLTLLPPRNITAEAFLGALAAHLLYHRKQLAG